MENITVKEDDHEVKALTSVNNKAILMGDFMYSSGLEIASKLNNTKVIS